MLELRPNIAITGDMEYFQITISTTEVVEPIRIEKTSQGTRKGSPKTFKIKIEQKIYILKMLL